MSKNSSIILYILLGAAIGAGVLLLLSNTQVLGSQKQLQMSNDETWSWTDYKGRKREFVIHRQIKGN